MLERGLPTSVGCFQIILNKHFIQDLMLTLLLLKIQTFLDVMLVVW